MEEKVILVDTNDKEIGQIEKIKAHKTGQLHRAVSIFIFNHKKELLLQKRALNKYHSPGLWTNTVCTHPKPGETIEEAAIRRLYEEMGIKDTQIFKIFEFIYKEDLNNGLIEHEYDHVFIGFSDALPIPNPEEVCDFKYINLENILEQVKKYPQDYTVWFKLIINRVISEVQNLTF